MDVTNGCDQLENEGGEQLIGTASSASSMMPAPPVIIPPEKGIQVTMPNSIADNKGSGKGRAWQGQWQRMRPSDRSDHRLPLNFPRGLRSPTLSRRAAMAKKPYPRTEIALLTAAVAACFFDGGLRASRLPGGGEQEREFCLEWATY